MKHFAARVLKPPVSTARAVDKKKMYFHVDSQIAMLPGSGEVLSTYDVGGPAVCVSQPRYAHTSWR